MIGALPFKYLIVICILIGAAGLELTYQAKAIAPAALVRLYHSAAQRRILMQASDKPPAVLVSSILARPLFNPSRLPAPSGKRTGRHGKVPRLSGVIIYGADRLAIFAGPRGGQPIVAAKGDKVGDWAISLIEPGWVTLVGHGRSQRIQPMFVSPSTMTALSAPAVKPSPLAVAMAASHRALLKLLERGR